MPPTLKRAKIIAIVLAATLMPAVTNNKEEKKGVGKIPEEFLELGYEHLCCNRSYVIYPTNMGSLYIIPKLRQELRVPSKCLPWCENACTVTFNFTKDVIFAQL